MAPSERSEAPLRDSAARTHRGDGGDANITGEQIGGAACSGGGGMTVAFGRERRRERESEKISYGVPMGGGARRRSHGVRRRHGLLSERRVTDKMN